MRVPRVAPVKMATKGAKMQKTPMVARGAAKQTPMPRGITAPTYGVQGNDISADVASGMSGLKGVGNQPARTSRMGVQPKMGKSGQMGAGGKKRS